MVYLPPWPWSPLSRLTVSAAFCTAPGMAVKAADFSVAKRHGVRIRVVSSSALLLASSTLIAAAQAAPSQRPAALADLSLEQLAGLQVTSVSKTAKPVSDAPASVFVITEQEIHRAGAPSLQEALRLAPNLQVARLDARNYAISARGFNNRFANKLLVMIDGRTVYSPLYSGVFWEAQDVILEDLDRIEVISGPGGTLWGANAVNGVINVLTRSAADTQGEMISIGGGNLEQHAAARYGGAVSETLHYRVFAKHSRHDASRRADNSATDSAWDRTYVGFRADSNSDGANLTVQGDAYQGRLQQAQGEDIEIFGANLMVRGDHSLSPGSKLSLQVYLDQTRRDQPGFFAQHLTALDLDLQHEWAIGERHNLVWGGGYRYVIDDIDNGETAAFLPEDINMHWRNVFAQNTTSLHDNLRLSLGIKLEDNPFTNWEALPSAQLAWTPNPSRLVWAGVSRAVRSPSRFDRDLYTPANPPVEDGVPQYILQGSSDFESEVAEVLELGYRRQPTANANYSLTGFYSRYDRLRTLEPGPNGVGEIFANLGEATAYGVELWGSWQATRRWRLRAGVVAQQFDFSLEPGSADNSQNTSLAIEDPDLHGLIRSSFDASEQLKLEATLRYVGELQQTEVPAYTALDLRVGWAVRPQLEVSLAAQNLLGGAHAEFGRAPERSEFDRAVYAKLVWGL